MNQDEDKRIEIASGQSVVIDKLFGSTVFMDLRITANLQRCCWVIERMTILPCPDPAYPKDSDQYPTWVEWCTIPAQFDWEFRNDH